MEVLQIFTKYHNGRMPIATQFNPAELARSHGQDLQSPFNELKVADAAHNTVILMLRMYQVIFATRDDIVYG